MHARTSEPKTLELQFFKDVEQYAGLAKLKWTYPSRPLEMMKSYPFSTLIATNFNVFQIMLQDPLGLELSAEISKALELYKGYFEANGPEPLRFDLLCETLPVVVRRASANGVRFYRAEINSLLLNEVARKVCVFLVDLGRDAWVNPSDIYQPSVALLRLPKLALTCSLSQMIPFNSASWDPDVDYKKILTGEGKCPSTVQFLSNVKGSWAVYVCVDGVDIGLQAMMLHQIADVLPLSILPVLGDKKPAFPKFDFSDWIGLKIPCFAVKSLSVPEAIIQLDTVRANQLVSDIAKYIEEFPGVFKMPFDKKPGAACLCRFGDADGEIFRAEIREIMDVGSQTRVYGVKYVDYGEYAVVKESMIYYIPDELQNVPECASKVVIAELIPHSNFFPDNKLTEEQLAIIKKYLKDKDIICSIVTTKHEWAGANDGIVVTVSVPKSEDDLVGVKLSELLKINGLSEVRPIAHFGSALSMDVAIQIFGLGSRYYPGVTYVGVLSYCASFSSIFLQLEDDSQTALKLTKEMTEFYSGCDQEELKAMTISEGDFVTPGGFLAVQQEIDGELGWYRARVLRVIKQGQETLVELIYIDFGDVDHVNINNVRPLIPYFVKNPVLAVQAAVPLIDSLVDEDGQSVAVLEYCEHGGVTLEVQLDPQGTTFAWVKKAGSPGLEEWLIQRKLATGVVQKACK